MVEVKGIDVSHWQGIIDFKKVKESGVDFVIIKAGGSDSKKRYKDKKFEQYYNEAKSCGLNVGAYYFNGANTINHAIGVEDALHFAEIIKGKTFEYPVFMDIEAQSTKYKTGITNACIGFCSTMEKLGYYVGIYASDVSGFHDRIILDSVKQFDKWVARYGVNPRVVKDYGIWQYSSKGKINGIVGNVDLDYAYKDYPAIMKKAHLNGF